MSSAKTIIKNTTALAVGRILTKAGSLVFLGYMTRVLGESGFGRFSTAMALVGFVEVVPGYVARTFVIRQVARDREKSGAFLAGVIWSNIILSVLLFWALVAVVPLLGYAEETRLACYILAASLLFSSVTNSYHAVFAGRERMELSALTDLFNAGLTIGLGVLVLVSGGGIVPLVGAYFAGRLVTFFLARRLAHGLLEDKRFRLPDRVLWRTLIFGAWPFFITQLFIVFYNRADILMLSFMDSTMDKEIAVGHYNAAYKLMEALGLLTSAFVMSVYPVLARKFLEGPDGVLVVFRKAFRVLCALVLPVAVGTTILARDLMGLLFGQNYAAAGAALQILIWGQAMDSINPLAAVTLRALEKEKELAKITGVCAVFNVALNIVLIPRYSYMGAAVATLLSFLLVFGWSYVVLAGALGRLRIGGMMLRSLAAALLMGAVVFLVRDHGLVVAVLVGVVTYVPLAFLLGVVNKEELKSLANR